MRLAELIGTRVLEGARVENYGEGMTLVWLRLNGITYGFVGHSDPHRPGNLSNAFPCTGPNADEVTLDGDKRTITVTPFDPPIVVAISMRQTNQVGGDPDDILVVTEKLYQKRLILELGTDRSDYYTEKFLFAPHGTFTATFTEVEYRPPPRAQNEGDELIDEEEGEDGEEG